MTTIEDPRDVRRITHPLAEIPLLVVCGTSADWRRLRPHRRLGRGLSGQRTTNVVREGDWLSGARRFPGEPRLPGVACIVRVQARIERGGKICEETRFYIASATLSAERAGQAVRGHWAIETAFTGCWT